LSAFDFSFGFAPALVPERLDLPAAIDLADALDPSFLTRGDLTTRFELGGLWGDFSESLTRHSSGNCLWGKYTPISVG
jgi:hypothetical protein